MVIVRNLATLREPAALYGWARRIAVRESLRQLRPANETITATVPDQGDIDAFTTALADHIDVNTVLAKLTPEHRAVLVLRYLEDLSEDDTAELLAIDIGTVKSRTSRARTSFARKWNP